MMKVLKAAIVREVAKMMLDPMMLMSATPRMIVGIPEIETYTLSKYSALLDELQTGSVWFASLKLYCCF